jgi:hypothetical protein
MEIEEIYIEGADAFLTGDFLSSDSCVVIDKLGRLIWNGQLLNHKISYDFERPLLTILDKNRFLIVETDMSISSPRSQNAWILDNNGRTMSEFHIGQVSRLISTDKHIISTYSPSSYYPGHSLEFEAGGLAVFDFEGNCIYKFVLNSQKTIDFFEIYAIFNLDNRNVYLLTYPKIDLLRFDTKTFELNMELDCIKNNDSISDDFWLPRAISKKGEDWYFLTPSIEFQKSIIFKMDKLNSIVEIGRCNYAFSPIGLTGGRFFIPSYNWKHSDALNCQIIHV